MNIREEKNNSELYQHYIAQFLRHVTKHERNKWTSERIRTEVFYEDIKNGIEKAVGVSDISDEDLQYETTSPLVIEEYKKLIKPDGYDFVKRL